MKRDQHFETRAIHTGYKPNEHFDSLTPPIYQTSTFTFASMEQGGNRFAGEEAGYVYSRLGNPTVQILEQRIAELEGGEAALAFGSGMAAVSAILVGLTKANDHILVSNGVYGCTFGLLTMLKEKYNIDATFSPMDSVEEILANIQDNTTCIYVETPINPTMQLIDLELVVRVAKEKGIKVIVDNTFATPYLQQPIALGCDFVVHSATKYIGGHGDVVAGVLIGDKETIQLIRKTTQKDMGGVISPFDAWLLLRGLKTLAVRMDRHCENAEKLAEKLKEHPKVSTVLYPGDFEHPDHSIVAKQMKKGGGLLSFEIKGTEADIAKVVNQLKLIRIAVSLGDAETLIQHPATMTHAVVPEERRTQMGISKKLLRMSAGLEAWQDVWADLEQALNQL
ncbi:methionine gamma-lyase [Halalkalibacterium halodurans]|uniref:L-methionine gamma-lyase n=1 Tax=Halalkalibacterium halodurans TaxID=86665 RepID=A0A0M0KD06_ALKHA|nr:methionine gamma-lyase [Halalkalibacterium halodurans]MDY7221300.1 methionine gamma-lyase [Halalkalibacterium halodurans]MDY7240539.1 methionine gamma-lyase [Halalkalibacterium halodurans]MED4163018.1 methionine gamma-lyase [Halalkalibacterium halodurans]TES49989.1 methionine gamma-lyase [Halalkalibacterium halodurans]TPE70263.1 methionine gamma-lyase [Halalkalibacterium halodurans]